MDTVLPANIGRPAANALQAAGIGTLERLTSYTEQEISALHGVGPKAIRLLKAALEERGMQFRAAAGRSDSFASIERATPADADYIRGRLIEHNESQSQERRYIPIDLCIRDDQDEIAAGIGAAICWNWAEVGVLWTDERCRGRGYGSRLLREVEEMAVDYGCTFVQLDTFSFQAPEFYRKLGYEEFAVLDDAPIGQKHYYFRKMLPPGSV